MTASRGIREQRLLESFFVDSEGNPVGDVVIGPDEEKYRSIIETYLADGE